MQTLTVRAVDGAMVPELDGSGRMRPGRYVGRDRKGAVLDEPVTVPADSYHRRAVARGELVEVRPAETTPAAPAPETPAPEAEPSASPETPTAADAAHEE